jgi:GT2 family glycosyltransferase
VIVVVHGGAATELTRCLRSVSASRGVRLQLVVVDNASPDGGAAAREAVDQVPAGMVTLVALTENRGFAAGVNTGLARRRGEYVLLLNDDAEVDPGAIARCVEVLRAQPPEVVAAAPVVHLADQPGIIDSAGLVLRPNGEAFSAGIGQPDLGQFRTGERCLGPCFAAALVRSSAFDPGSVGLLDERYFLYYEDVDWALRATLSGRTTVLVADAGVRHGHARSTRHLGEDRRYRMVQRNLLVCAALNLSLAGAARIWWGRHVVHAKGLVTGPYRRERITAITGALAMLPRALVDRRARRRLMTRADLCAFVYSQDAEPYFDAATYQATGDPAARDAAQRRLGAHS